MNVKTKITLLLIADFTSFQYGAYRLAVYCSSYEHCNQTGSDSCNENAEFCGVL